MVNTKFFSAIAVLTGTMMGAGFLGMPYVISKSGYLLGLLLLFLIGLFILYVKLCLGEVILRTKGNHQMTGYAEKYLGRSGKYLMFLAMIFGIYPALIAYLIAEGQTLSYIFTNSINSGVYFSVGFWIILSVLSYIGLTALKRFERIGLVLIGLIFIYLISEFTHNIQAANLAYINLSSIFSPFGIILFSFLAFSSLPEVYRVLSGKENLMKKTIIWGMVITFILYALFTLIVLGNFGTSVPEIATLALGKFASILAIITMFTASFAGIIAMRDIYRFDFKFKRVNGWILASFIPLILFLLVYSLNLASFVQIISIAGPISGGLTGICILLMARKAKKFGNRKPEYKMKITWPIIFFLSIIFILAVVMEIIL